MQATRPLRIRRWLLIGGLLLAHALFNYFAVDAALHLDQGGIWSFAVAIGVLLGQPALLGGWAMVGPGSRWLQIPRMLMLAGAAFDLLFLSGTSISFDQFFFFGLALFLASLVLFGAGVLLLGWRLVPIEAGDRESAVQLRQISLRRIFLDVLAAAAVLALWRYSPNRLSIGLDGLKIFNDAVAWQYFIVVLLPLLPIVGLTTSSGRRRTVWWFVVTLVCLVLAGGIVEWLLGTDDLIRILLEAVLCTASVSALVSFLVIRLAGYRLVNRRALGNAVSEQPDTTAQREAAPNLESAESHVGP